MGNIASTPGSSFTEAEDSSFKMAFYSDKYSG